MDITTFNYYISYHFWPLKMSVPTALAAYAGIILRAGGNVATVILISAANPKTTLAQLRPLG